MLLLPVVTGMPIPQQSPRLTRRYGAGTGMTIEVLCQLSELT